MQYAVITGVSSGIGKATALEFLKKGLFVFGTVRKESDALEFETNWKQQFKTLVFDSKDFNAIDQAVDQIKKIVGSQGLSLLVNNAGIAKYGPMQFIKIQDLREQFEVNVFSVIYLTQKLLPLLGANNDDSSKKGRIITISSAAGVFTRLMLGPYSASKHALEAAFDAFRRELFFYKIKVVLIQPGPIKTEIWEKVEMNENPYRGTIYEKIFDSLSSAVGDITKIAIPVEKVVDKIWKAYTIKNPKPRYLVAPKQFLFWLLMYVFPASLADKILINEVKKYNK